VKAVFKPVAEGLKKNKDKIFNHQRVREPSRTNPAISAVPACRMRRSAKRCGATFNDTVAHIGK